MKYKIFHKVSCAYYPRANGQAESTNKVLITLLKKMCHQKPSTWGIAYLGVLWAYRTAYKATTGHTPFQLLYGMEAIAPVEFIHGSTRVGTRKFNDSSRQALYAMIHLVEELRKRARENIKTSQLRRKQQHDHYLWKRTIQEGSLVLLYQPSLANRKVNKLITGWRGPYKVVQLLPQRAVKLATLEGELLPLVNASRVKPYQPLK
ncbi:hypothetical protein KP509_09G040900 [Ceratopteris richardii]|uniref:Integrase catalytic domain-containing protein n=1 Tax=Ceratopteris richardii TaxID=49495 RepID=A0A8T2U7E5_CERRI|nr:hypothetical protein KP509_09G040900 [Ceratopteris richardii]